MSSERVLSDKQLRLVYKQARDGATLGNSDDKRHTHGLRAVEAAVVAALAARAPVNAEYFAANVMRECGELDRAKPVFVILSDAIRSALAATVARVKGEK